MLTRFRHSATSLITLALLAPLAATAQTSSPTARSSATHPSTTHARSTAHRSTTAAGTADNPPGVPRVIGTPKVLFALRYVDITVGSGPLALEHNYYTVQYTGWLPDGTKFDSSYDHGAPLTFPYGAHQVITGWDTGFEGMHVGGKRRLYIPYQLAYGATGRPPVIPAKANLIFDIELVSMSENPPPRPEAPTPPEPTPGDAQTAPGEAHPTATPPPAGSTNPSANPTAPPPTQSTTPSTQPSTKPNSNPTTH